MFNEVAWQAWKICHRAGRDGMSGQMLADQIFSVTTSLGGDVEDVERVLSFEEIHQQNKEDKEE